jgi:hypothetical protein
LALQERPGRMKREDLEFFALMIALLIALALVSN